MKVILSTIALIFISSSLLASGYLDSAKVHFYCKLTAYPFSLPKYRATYPYTYRSDSEIGIALGPSLSLIRKQVEFQVSLLYDFNIYHKYVSHGYSVYQRLAHPLFRFNYNINLSKTTSVFPSVGAVANLPLATYEYHIPSSGKILDRSLESGTGAFIGGGISCMAEDKVKLSGQFNMLLRSYFAPAGFFEIAFLLR